MTFTCNLVEGTAKHEDSQLLTWRLSKSIHSMARERDLSMSHSRAIIPAEEVQPWMRTQNIPVNLLHHLSILHPHYAIHKKVISTAVKASMPYSKDGHIPKLKGCKALQESTDLRCYAMQSIAKRLLRVLQCHECCLCQSYTGLFSTLRNVCSSNAQA